MEDLKNKATEVFEQDAEFSKKFIEFAIQKGKANELTQKLNQEGIAFLKEIWLSKNEKERLDFDIKQLVNNGILSKEEGEPYLDVQYVNAGLFWEKASEEERVNANLEHIFNIGAISVHTYNKYKALQKD